MNTPSLIGLRASESTEEELQSIFNINLFSLVATDYGIFSVIDRSCNPSS
jgi:hypothetical protein